MVSKWKQMDLTMTQVNDEDCPFLYVLQYLLHCQHAASWRVVPMHIIKDLRPNSLHM